MENELTQNEIKKTKLKLTRRGLIADNTFRIGIFATAITFVGTLASFVTPIDTLPILSSYAVSNLVVMGSMVYSVKNENKKYEFNKKIEDQKQLKLVK